MGVQDLREHTEFFGETKLKARHWQKKVAEHHEAIKHASLITGVPGGVGPMTIIILPVNTLIAALSHVSLNGFAIDH